jgi:hypothetical protein
MEGRKLDLTTILSLDVQSDSVSYCMIQKEMPELSLAETPIQNHGSRPRVISFACRCERNNASPPTTGITSLAPVELRSGNVYAEIQGYMHRDQQISNHVPRNSLQVQPAFDHSNGMLRSAI